LAAKLRRRSLESACGVQGEIDGGRERELFLWMKGNRAVNNEGTRCGGVVNAGSINRRGRRQVLSYERETGVF